MELVVDASPSRVRQVVVIGLLVLALAGCASADEGAAGEQDQRVLGVMFDGTSCSYDGPSDVGAGVVSIEAANDSDVYTEVGIARIDESSMFEDFVAFYPPEPEVVDSPDFATPIGSVPAEPGQTGSDTFALGAGQYALVCLILISEEPPPGVFVAQPGGLVVIE